MGQYQSKQNCVIWTICAVCYIITHMCKLNVLPFVCTLIAFTDEEMEMIYAMIFFSEYQSIEAIKLAILKYVRSTTRVAVRMDGV